MGLWHTPFQTFNGRKCEALLLGGSPSLVIGTVFDKIDAAKRAMDRTEAIVHGDLENGIPQFAIIVGVAPLIGLFGTVLLLGQALRGFARGLIDTRGLADWAGRSLIPLAAGIAIAVLAYWMFEHFSAALESLDRESRNSASELADYFLKRLSRSAMK